MAALKPSAYLGTKVDGGASGATSQLTLTLIRSKEAKMKKLIFIALAVLLVFGISTFANAQVPFPGEKVYISGTNPVGMGKADTTVFTYRIDLTDANPTMVVLDVVPAEFDVTALTPMTCPQSVYHT